MESTLNQAIEYIRNIAPAVWAILMKQVYSNAIVSTVGCIIFIIVTVAFLWGIRYCIKRHEKDSYSEWEMGVLFLSTGTFITSLISFFALVDAFQKFYNPEFYAIQQIIQVTR